MHAFLIVGNNPEQEVESRIAALNISPWDVHRAAGSGIADIRALCRDLSLAPRGKQHVGIIEHMELLTPEAQNALLKTLEEPPPHTYIIGTTRMPEALLPTILSRMTIVHRAETKEKTDISCMELLTQSIGKRLQETEKYTATRDDAKQFVTSLLESAQEELLKHPSHQLTALIRNLFAAQSHLSVNVNPRLVLDNAVVNLA